MRDEMIGAVLRRAVENANFRDQLMRDPHDALQRHGFALEPDDFQEIERLRDDLRSGDVEQKLETIAEKYGIETKR